MLNAKAPQVALRADLGRFLRLLAPQSIQRSFRQCVPTPAIRCAVHEGLQWADGVGKLQVCGSIVKKQALDAFCRAVGGAFTQVLETNATREVTGLSFHTASALCRPRWTAQRMAALRNCESCLRANCQAPGTRLNQPGVYQIGEV